VHRIGALADDPAAVHGDDSGATKEAVMTISNDFRFPVSVSGESGQLARVTAPGLEEIEVAVPPEFRGPGGRWSPEHLLVASAASCFAVTFAAVAERRRIPLHSLTVSATGHVGHRDDGRVGFIALELTPRIRTEPEFVAAAKRTARATDTACLITGALDVPVHVMPVVTAVEPALA
jgi:organic hydroperoxide reductase OsmC/OhrA